MFEVLNGGLETSIQDFPGRIGKMTWGIPRSGPLDPYSFRLGNRLVGNPPNAAGLEIQFGGPKLRFLKPAAFAVTGADNCPMLNGKPIELWRSHTAGYDDVLSFGFAKLGARTYLSFSGGIDVPDLYNSRSTFIHAGVGGIEGRALKRGDVLQLGTDFDRSALTEKQTISEEKIPRFSTSWEVEVLLGPHDDWLLEDDLDGLLTTKWTVSSRSNRIGYRLEGLEFQFSEKAHNKPPANGSHPSNKIDYGCPVGALLLCGQTPTILLADAPSLTGYMTPCTVVTGSLWKIGQARPGDAIRLRSVDLEKALAINESLEAAVNDALPPLIPTRSSQAVLSRYRERRD